MFEKYPPTQPGYIRCATVQSEVILTRLLAEGLYKPSRTELKAHGMTAGCPDCVNTEKWCWSEAHDWMFQECASKLNFPDMNAGIWLYAHDDPIENCKEAYNHVSEDESKEGKVLLVADIPIDRILRSDWILFHRVAENAPVPSSGMLDVNLDLEENQNLRERWYEWHHNPGLSEEEKIERKRHSWQIIFEDSRWPSGIYDDSMGNSDPSIVQGITPFLALDDLVDVIFPTEFNTWDLLRQGQSLQIYGTLEDLSVVFLTGRGITSKRIGMKSAGAMYGHQKQHISKKFKQGIVHRRKYFYKEKHPSFKMRTGESPRTAKLIVSRG